MPAIETNQYALWAGKQSAKGTPAATPPYRMVQVGGVVGVNRDIGSEKYSDGTKYGTATDFANSLLGSGELALQATPIETAYWFYLLNGAEAVSTIAAAAPIPALSRHQFTPSPGRGFWFGAFQKTGSSTIVRDRNDDCLVTKLVLEASSANKVMRLTPTVISLDPAVKFTADPVKALPTERPFLHTDASANAGATSDGKISVNGTTFRTANQFRIEVDEAWTPYYGDATTPAEMIQGEPSVAVATTILADENGVAWLNMETYGTASPALGAKPLRNVPARGAFETVHRQRDNSGAFTGIAMDVTVPAVQWTLPGPITPNPAGGLTEIPIAGTMRAPASGQPYTIGFNLPSSVIAFT